MVSVQGSGPGHGRGRYHHHCTLEDDDDVDAAEEEDEATDPKNFHPLHSHPISMAVAVESPYFIA